MPSASAKVPTFKSPRDASSTRARYCTNVISSSVAANDRAATPTRAREATRTASVAASSRSLLPSKRPAGAVRSTIYAFYHNLYYNMSITERVGVRGQVSGDVGPQPETDRDLPAALAWYMAASARAVISST